jgi:hypothetical protein
MRGTQSITTTQILKALSKAQTVKAACEAVPCGRDTVLRRAAQNPKVAAALAACKARAPGVSARASRARSAKAGKILNEPERAQALLAHVYQQAMGGTGKEALDAAKVWLRAFSAAKASKAAGPAAPAPEAPTKAAGVTAESIRAQLRRVGIS